MLYTRRDTDQKRQGSRERAEGNKESKKTEREERDRRRNNEKVRKGKRTRSLSERERERQSCLEGSQTPVCSLRTGLSDYLSLSFTALQGLGDVL